MDVDPAAESDPESVPLHVRQTGLIDLERAISAFGDLAWFGEPADASPEHPDRRRFATDLELPILDGSATGPVRKAAVVEFGPARRVDDRVLVEIAWWSATFAPLFPVFAGELVISAFGVTLDGRYAPPAGRLGLRLDHALLHLVAERTAGGLLARLTVALAG
jgi:hypothetical protein